MNQSFLPNLLPLVLLPLIFSIIQVHTENVVGVMFPGSNEILYQDLTVNELKSFYSLVNQTGPNALALDNDGVLSNNVSKIYFSISSPTASIYRCNLKDRCSGLQQVYDSGASSAISGISLDFVNSKMYWVEGSTFLTVTGSNIQTLLTGLQSPNKITVDPSSGYFYVALSSKNNGNTAGDGVGKATLSGSNFTKILAANLVNAKGVAYDWVNDTLYVTDSTKDSGASMSDGNEKILSSSTVVVMATLTSLDDTGGAAASLTNGNMAVPVAASIHINQTAGVKVLYWIDSSKQTVWTYDLISGDRSILFQFTSSGGSDLALHIADAPLNLTKDTTTGSSTDSSTANSSSSTTNSGDNTSKGSGDGKALMIAAIVVPTLCTLCFAVTATGVFIKKRKHDNEDEKDVEKSTSFQSTSAESAQGGTTPKSKESMYEDLQSRRNTQVAEMQMESISNTSDLSLPGNFSNGNDIVISTRSSSHTNSNVALPGENSNDNSSDGTTKDRTLAKSKSGYLYTAKAKNSYEVDYEELSFGKELGRGAYGVVFLGEYRHQKVAIKKLLRTDLSPQQIDDFKEEGMLMSALKPHKNGAFFIEISLISAVVTTLGVCVTKELCIVTEYLPMGSLLAYLKHAKIDPKRIIKIGKDIAAGMAHLAREGIVHRDLAARNLLMTESLDIKISDFGMARVLENEDENSGKTESTTGPLKWMAPECISQRQYSTKSDVWAFGITMIEILTKDIPYPGESPVTVCIKVVNGHKHQIPENCPVGLATLIDQCWAFDPQKRPDFDHIFTTLEKMKL